MIEWFIFLAAVVLPLVVGRCIAFGMSGHSDGRFNGGRQ